MPVFTGISLALGALASAGTAVASSVGAAAASAAAATGVTGAAATGLTAAETAAAVASGGAAAAPWAAGTTVAGAAGLSLGGTATALGALGTVGGLASSGVQMLNSQAAAAEQQKQEALRAKQMQLESSRQRREVIRQSQIAQAIGINNAANSGADVAGSSALTGVMGQTATNAGFALNSINQNEAIGNALFASNAAESGYNATGSLFGGVSKLGFGLADNNMQGARLLTTLFG